MSYDAVVVGAGPNGLAAAIELQRNGLSVLLVEANETVGGACRTEECTLPGFRHDVGSAVHPLGIGSPFFSSLPLGEHGLEWVHPTLPLAHPLPDGRAATLAVDLDATAAQLGEDGARYRRAFQPFVSQWDDFARQMLDSPFRPAWHPGLALRLAPWALRGAPALARSFRSREARALIAGNAAHSGTPLEHALTGAVGLLLMTAAHRVGWPFPRGGAGRLTAALADHFRSLGGTLETGRPVSSLGDLPDARAVLFALTFRQVARIAGDALPSRYRAAAGRWRHGPGAFKVDWALDAPIPWADPRVESAGTVHVGGTLEEIAASEREPWRGRVGERPFVLLAQPTLFDPTRAPEGRHTAWAYAHVPNGWDGDLTDVIEAQVERFAPGFRERILGRAVWSPARLEAWDANLVGGDVNGGALTLAQTVGAGRWPLRGWRIGQARGFHTGGRAAELYVCSASTPPGGGVHGMAGYHGARAALGTTFGIRTPPL
jgi:phytoene dehydrogenase-like protein